MMYTFQFVFVMKKIIQGDIFQLCYKNA